MLSGIIWSLVLFYVIYTENSSQPIRGKMLFIHSLLLWVFLMLFFSSAKMIGWAVWNPTNIQKYFYVNVGIIPDWLNLLSWTLGLVFGIIAIFLTFMLARRKEYARKKFVALLPIFYTLSVFDMFKSFYGFILSQDGSASVSFIAISSLIIQLLVFAPMYYFYNSSPVKKDIFNNKRQALEIE